VFDTLREIIRDNWDWRSQMWPLALTEIRKEVRGSVLGWLWLLITPAMYIGVLWLAFAIGLRVTSAVDGVPFITWLAAGVIPWQFCSGMITGGSNVYRRYPYLVNRLRFPLSVISGFYVLAGLLVFLLTMVPVIIIMVATHTPFTIHAAQFPVVVILMYFFWFSWSMLTSPLSALSKDFHSLLRTLSTPLFWVSGVFFNIDSMHISWLKTAFLLNPIAFFVSSIRACFGENYWIWERPQMLWLFVGVLALTFVFALVTQKRLSLEVADVL
jgi:teichoic acid transport system permease protein